MFKLQVLSMNTTVKLWFISHFLRYKNDWGIFLWQLHLLNVRNTTPQWRPLSFFKNLLMLPIRKTWPIAYYNRVSEGSCRRLRDSIILLCLEAFKHIKANTWNCFRIITFYKVRELNKLIKKILEHFLYKKNAKFENNSYVIVYIFVKLNVKYLCVIKTN